MKKTHISYAIGTVVGFIDTPGRAGIIDTIQICQDSLEYGVNGCAWYKHSNLIFISHPTKETLAEAFKVDRDEEDDEEEYE